MTPEDVYLASISGGKLAHRIMNIVNCQHPKVERCLFYNNIWWDLCLSCGSIWGSIAWEENGKWDAEHVSDNLKNITQ